MSPAFPVRHIDKTDPRYHGLPPYVFMLQPPLQGAPVHECVRFAEDLLIQVPIVVPGVA